MDPHAHRVQLITGKGGVGKSTILAGFALASARAGHRPLIVELGHRASMETLFETAIGYTPRSVGSGVSAMRIELEPALIDYVRSQVRMRGLAERIVRGRVLNRFFRAAPAVAEVVTLRAIEKLADQGEYHPILVDLDSTGHALMFLSLPDVFEGLVAPGPLHALLDSTTALLRDETRTVLHLATVPQTLPARETADLHRELARRDDVALGALIVNRVPLDPLPPETLVALPSMPDDDADAALARRVVRRVQHQRRLTTQLEQLHARSVRLHERTELEGPRKLEPLVELGVELLEAMATA